MIAGLFALLFFAPAGFIYGRYRARLLRSRPGTLFSRLASLLPVPALFLVCAVIAIIHENAQAQSGSLSARGLGIDILETGSSVADGVLTLARWIGEAELILFMLAIPFLLGAAIAALLLILDARGVIALARPARPDEDDIPPSETRP